MKVVQKSENVQSASEIQCDHWATKEEIREASMKIFVEMYGGTKECLLRKLRRALLFPFSKFLLTECQQFSRHLPFSYLLCLSVLSNCYISAFTFTITQQSHLKIYLVLLSLSTNRTTHIYLQQVTKHVGTSNFNETLRVWKQPTYKVIIQNSQQNHYLKIKIKFSQKNCPIRKIKSLRKSISFAC